NVNASEAISGLAPNTKYHYRLVASNSSGTTTGADKTFKTPNTAAPTAPAGAPTVATGGAKGVTATSATLTGTVNPNGQSTTYYFKYGTTTNYGGTTPSGSASGTKNVNVSATISGLAANTTYHYRLIVASPL